jgi:acetyl-CoA acetyltransferase
MSDTVICEPVRAPGGQISGALRDSSAAELAAVVVSAVLDRTKVEPTVLDDVVLGQAYSNKEAPAIGRVAALDTSGSGDWTPARPPLRPRVCRWCLMPQCRFKPVLPLGPG